MILGVLAGASVPIIIYALWLRAWMDRQTSGWPRRFLDWIEPIEIRWWKKSETILVAQWLKFSSFLVMSLGVLEWLVDLLAGFDVSTILPIIPPQYAARVAFFSYLLGVINKMLRERTRKPLELVAIPNAAPVEVKVAAAQAASANDTAVAVAESAKAPAVVDAAPSPSAPSASASAE